MTLTTDDVEAKTVRKAIDILSTGTTRSVEKWMISENVHNVLELAEKVLFGQVTYWNKVDPEDVLLAVRHLNNIAEHPESDDYEDEDEDNTESDDSEPA